MIIQMIVFRQILATGKVPRTGVFALKGAMRRNLLTGALRHSGIALSLLTTSLAVAPNETKVSLTKGSGQTWNIEWSGESGRTYFIQWSTDLTNWNYLPTVAYGAGIMSYGVNPNDVSKYFIRSHMVYDTSVSTLQQARDADFDNDGIPNYYEVENLGTNPLDQNSAGGDIDNDGLADGWEKFYFGGLGIANPTAILQPDGLTNKEKAELGLDPTKNYFATNSAQPTSYTYDPVGRLTGITAPVGSSNYIVDSEGNISTQ